MRLACLIALLLLAPCALSDVTVVKQDKKTLVTVSGEIKREDMDTLDEVYLTTTLPVDLTIASNGGNYLAGLMMGITVNKNRTRTQVYVKYALSAAAYIALGDGLDNLKFLSETAGHEKDDSVLGLHFPTSAVGAPDHAWFISGAFHQHFLLVAGLEPKIAAGDTPAMVYSKLYAAQGVASAVLNLMNTAREKYGNNGLVTFRKDRVPKAEDMTLWVPG